MNLATKFFLVLELSAMLSTTLAASNPNAVSGFASNQNATVRCNLKRAQQIDATYIKFASFGPDGRPLPTNTKELRIFCNESSRYVEQIESYINECRKPESRDLAKVFFYSVKRAMKQICTPKRMTKRLQNLLSAGKCFNPIIHEIPCIENLTEKVKEMIPYRIENEKIKHTCCFSVDMIKCMEDLTISRPCMTEALRESVMDLIRSLVADLTNVACGEYNESTDRCQTLKWPPPKQLYDPTLQVEPWKKSFLLIGLQMVESIENFQKPI